MSEHVLDTSALLIHYFREPGWERVAAILGDERTALAAPSILEFVVRAVTSGVPRHQALADLERYLEVAGELLPIDRAAAAAAVTLRLGASARVPTVDCLIAGCAASRGAVLVHRDAHFRALAPELAQLDLEPGLTPPFATGP